MLEAKGLPWGSPTSGNRSVDGVEDETSGKSAGTVRGTRLLGSAG